jgi:hypothetical protein
VKHTLFTNEQYPRTSWKTPPSLMGLSNGVRELMLLIPNTDPAREWQIEEVGKYLADFQLPDDIVLYAVDKTNLSEKGRTFTVTTDPAIPTDRTIKIARLQFAGNWDPEPGAWRRLSAILHNRSHIQLDISVAKLGSHQLGDGKTGATVAVLTGTNSFKLTEPAKQELKDFLQGGGTLIVDSAGGDSDFASGFESELAAILGGDTSKQLQTPLPATDPVFNQPGGVIKDFVYRPFARMNIGSLHGPMLAAVKIDNRPAVYYSRWDLTAGMVGQPTDGINGYSPETATAIMRNLIINTGLGSNASVLADNAAVAAKPTTQPAPPAGKKTENKKHK